EELETSNEEIKSSNEEILSMNEELQSTNEELETSKEELQSVNEELVTVNAELQNKLELLTRSNNDLSNLLESTQIATVFLDRKLAIQNYTPAIAKVLNVIQTDVGRPIEHISQKVAYPDLASDAQEVLKTLVPKQRELTSAEGTSYLVRMLPYRTVENVIDGIVITFVDISETKMVERALRELQKRVVLHLQRTPLAIIEWNPDLQVVEWNPAAERLFGIPKKDALGERAMDLGIFAPEPEKAEAMWKGVLEGKSTGPTTLRIASARGRIATCEWYNTLLVDEQGRTVGVACRILDVTERREAEEKIAASLREKDVLLHEIHHRVRGNLQLVSSLLRLHADLLGDARSRKVFGDCERRVRFMALVHDRLYHADDLARIDFGEYVQQVMADLARAQGLGADRMELLVHGEGFRLPIGSAIPCALVVGELVSNALEHAFPEGRKGRVDVRLASGDGRLTLEVRDDGVGLPPTVDPQNPRTLGLQLVKTLVGEQLRGRMKVSRDGGTTFSISMPVADPAAGAP
ncbi:MAG TPA: PAS domain-containing protein, partial [Planctomycetota bacterium]|nr:PAS domain-containing protein [Planctomycetota bacterium]